MVNKPNYILSLLMLSFLVLGTTVFFVMDADAVSCEEGESFGVSCQLRLEPPYQREKDQRLALFKELGIEQSGLFKVPQVIHFVSSPQELTSLSGQVNPGEQVVLSDGVWNNVSLEFQGSGTTNQPILIRPESSGGVVVTGKSRAVFTGQNIIIYDLKFQSGLFDPLDSSRSDTIFKLGDEETIRECNHCIVTDILIRDYVSDEDSFHKYVHYMKVYGQNNTIAYSTFQGQKNRGHSIWIPQRQEEAGPQRTHVLYNFFYDRTEADGGGGQEAIQIGSLESLAEPSYSLIEGNLISRYKGFPGLITLKSSDVVIRNNTFKMNKYSILLRGSNRSLIESNYFIGYRDPDITNGNDNHAGGINVSGKGHWIVNNYFSNNHPEDDFHDRRYPISINTGQHAQLPNTEVRCEKTTGMPQSKQIVISHNTFVNNAYNIAWGSFHGSSHNCYDLPPKDVLLTNNVFRKISGDQIPVIEFINHSDADIQHAINMNVLEINGISAEVSGFEDLGIDSIEGDQLLSFNSDLSLYLPRSNNLLIGTAEEIPGFNNAVDILDVSRIYSSSAIGATSRAAVDLNTSNVLTVEDVGYNSFRDNCLNVFNPDQIDADNDGFGNACDADIDNTGTVGLSDFGILTSVWGCRVTDSEEECPGLRLRPEGFVLNAVDLDSSGVIGTADFNHLFRLWGKQPGPSNRIH